MTTVIPAAHYYDKKQEVEDRIQKLAGEIEADQQRVAELETEYKQLIFAEEDDKADEVFQEKQSLAGKIKSKKSRLQTIKDMKEEDLLKFAVEAMESAVKGLPAVYQTRADELTDDVEAAKAAYLEALNKVSSLNQEYAQAHAPYKEIFKEVGFNSTHQGESRKRGMTTELLNRLSYSARNRLVFTENHYVKSYQGGRWVLKQEKF